jgi:ABC-type transport system involved in multi-copper enzyme maturation permease subunit
MARFRLLLRNELRLFRTAVPIHAVALLQPTILYLLMSTILVHPTFEMNVAWPTTEAGDRLLEAMSHVGSPIGLPYIEPVIVPFDGGPVARQVVVVEDQGGHPVAVQHFGLIDSNLVKNYRNRLTAAGLRLWNEALDGRAVSVEESAWLPHDMPYNIYFGMALLPMTVFVAASFLGAILVAQEFEFQTILEYRLAPLSPAWILAARLTRLLLLALLSAVILSVVVGLRSDAWPDLPWLVVLILVPVALIAGCLGMLAGLLLRRSIPAFLVGLVASFAGWVMGSGFGLAAGFGGWYERLSRLTPFTHAVELIFPRYFGAVIGRPALSVAYLLLVSAAMLVLTAVAYRWRVVRQA